MYEHSEQDRVVRFCIFFLGSVKQRGEAPNFHQIMPIVLPCGLVYSYKLCLMALYPWTVNFFQAARGVNGQLCVGGGFVGFACYCVIYFCVILGGKEV